MIIEEMPIGTIFQYEYVMLEVVEEETGNCLECYFEKNCPNNIVKKLITSCIKREDGKTVIYKPKYD